MQHETTSTFNDAEKFCKDIDAGLPVFDSLYEQTWFIKYYNEKNIWLGIKQIMRNSNQYKWTNGKDFVYTKWHTNQPTTDRSQPCRGAYLNGGFNSWISSPCDNKQAL